MINEATTESVTLTEGEAELLAQLEGEQAAKELATKGYSSAQLKGLMAKPLTLIGGDGVGVVFYLPCIESYFLDGHLTELFKRLGDEMLPGWLKAQARLLVHVCPEAVESIDGVETLKHLVRRKLGKLDVRQLNLAMRWVSAAWDDASESADPRMGLALSAGRLAQSPILSGRGVTADTDGQPTT